MPTQEHSASDSGSYDDSYHGSRNLNVTTARNSTTSTFDNQGGGSGFLAVNYILSGHAQWTVGFGGSTSTTNQVYRAFLSFPLGLGDWGGETINSVSLRLHQLPDLSSFFQNWSAEGSFYVVKATGAAAFTANTAWNDLDGWVSSGTYEGNVTKFSDAVSCSSNTTYNIDLNSDAVAAVQTMADNMTGGATLDMLHIALIHDSDWTDSGYPDTSPNIGTFEGAYIANMEHSTSSLRPLLTVTYGESEEAVTHNSVFFGTNF